MYNSQKEKQMSKFKIPDKDPPQKKCPGCNGDDIHCYLCKGTGLVDCDENDAWNNYINECESISDANKDEKE